jgi:response regulator of citrate/malate metabolism
MQTISRDNVFLDGSKIKRHLPKIHRVLIVEDDKTLQPIWSFVASTVSKNIQFDWATSELEAEDLIFEAMRNDYQYDLVIVDIFLEGARTGLDLYERFGHLFHDRMIITSGTEYQNYAEYLRQDAHAPYCLEKPLVPEECVKVVSKMLQ